MADTHPSNLSCIENKSNEDGGIIHATFDYEARLAVSETNEMISDYLVNLDSFNLNVNRVDSSAVSCGNDVGNELDGKMCGLPLGLNKTFDARQKKPDSNVARGVLLDKTINLLSMKPLNQSLHLDSEESLGIISDVLDDNNTLDLLVPFKSCEKSNVRFVKKSDDSNLIAFSPLHLRNSNRFYLKDNESPVICRFTSTPEPPSLKNPDMPRNYSPEEKVSELDIDPGKCYEDFKKGNIIASTSKKSQLKDCLNIFDATLFLTKDLHIESNEVQPEKDCSLEINSANQASLILNATFDMKPEPENEVVPIPELQTDAVSTAIEENPKNETYTMNNTAEEKDVKFNTTIAIDLPKKEEPNPSNLMDSCLSLSGTGETKQIEPDSYVIEPTKKSDFEVKKPMFKKSIAMPSQNLSPSKIKKYSNSKLNSTFSSKNSELTKNNPTKLDKRCSLGSSLRTVRHSNIGLINTHSQLNSNGVSNLKCTGYKVPEVKPANSLTRPAKMISAGKDAKSPMKQKHSIGISLSSTTIKPKVLTQIKKTNAEEVLNNTFTKDNKHFVLSPIIEKGSKFSESTEEVSDLSLVEKNCTISLSKIDEGTEIPKCIPSGNPDACAPLKNENKKCSTKCLQKPTVFTKRFHKVESTNILLLSKTKQSANDKLVSNNTANENIKGENQNINLNGKCNLSQTIKKDSQLSRLPTLGSTFSKKTIPKPKVNRMKPSDSLKVVPNQCSSTKSKPLVQSVRILRAPGIPIPKGKFK